MAQIHVSFLYEHNLPSQSTFYLQCTYCGNKNTCSLTDMTKYIYKKHFFAHICGCHRIHYFKKDELVLLYTKMYINEPSIIKRINDVIDPVTKQIESVLLHDDILDTATILFSEYMQFISTLES